MSAGVHDIGDEGLGERRDTRFKEAAMDAAKALVERDPRLERWVTPLVRAIRRGRLKLPSLSPTVQRVVKLIEAAEVDLDELADACRQENVSLLPYSPIGGGVLSGKYNVPEVPKGCRFGDYPYHDNHRQRAMADRFVNEGTLAATAKYREIAKD